MAKYLDDEGLRHLWLSLKELFGKKVDKEAGKALSTNDFDNTYKAKLDGISPGANEYVHPQYTSYTGKPTAPQSPGFGEAVTISQVVTDGLGHVTQVNDKTITIPDKAMGGATSSKAGAKGLVPAPSAGDQNKFLRGDGEWGNVVTEDRKVEVILNRTTKAYLLAATETPTRTSQSVTAVADTGVYLDTESGSLAATSFYGSGANLESLNAEKITTGTINASRLPNASSTTKGAMSAADKQKLDAFGSADTYALKSDITSMYRHKGSKQTVEELPSTGNVAGDVYNIIATGMNYVWTGTTWDALGEIFKIVSITNNEIDNILRT